MKAIYKDCYWFLSSALIFLSIFLHRIHCCVCQLVLLNELYDDDDDDDDVVYRGLHLGAVSC